MIDKNIISRIKSVITHDNFTCECGFEPDDPKDAFSINHDKTRYMSDFKKYDCPECGTTFQAIFCDCGRGYTCRANFKKVRSNGPGSQSYYCRCGELLHQHQRI